MRSTCSLREVDERPVGVPGDKVDSHDHPIVATCHATWTGLKYIDRAPRPTPTLAEILIEERWVAIPIEVPAAVKMALAIQHRKRDLASASRLDADHE